MSFGERLTGLIPWLLACLMFAGIVHFSSVLLMPQVAPHDSYGRLAPFFAGGGLHALPLAEPGQEALPFLDPAFAYAVCGYDLADGPLRLRASFAAVPYVSLSFHSRRGLVFYSFTDRAASHGKIDVVVLSGAQLAQAEEQDTEDEPVQELRLLAPENHGFVLLRALALAPPDMPFAQARLAAVTCAADKPTAQP